MKTTTLAARQITPEFWLATIFINEEGKSTNSCDFIVSEKQLAFLSILIPDRNFSDPIAHPAPDERGGAE
jgi:hypothetical protein